MKLTRPFSDTLNELRKDEDFLRADKLETIIYLANQIKDDGSADVGVGQFADIIIEIAESMQ